MLVRLNVGLTNGHRDVEIVFRWTYYKVELLQRGLEVGWGFTLELDGP